MRIVGGTICRPGELKRNDELIVRDGRIIAQMPGPREPGPSEEIIQAEGSYILPGFIEIHTHGAGLFEFTAGQYDVATGTFDSSPETYARELPGYAARRASTGVTSAYLGTWSAPPEQQKFCFRQLKKYMDSSGNGQDGCRIVGGLLEGTFLNPRMCGAQNPKSMMIPNVEAFEDLNESGAIRLVNVVPDFEEASYRLTEYLTGRGISVGAGHTNATGDQFQKAMEKGLKYCIHFLNGPIGNSYKSFNGGGGVEAVLGSDLYAEVIMDGVHVAPGYVRDILARKGEDKVMTVSDAMFASQAEGVREFSINGIPGRIDDGGQFAYVVGKEPLALFSSVLTMDVAFSNLLSWLTVESTGVWHRVHPALPLDHAIGIATQCCSTNIARMLKDRGGDDLEAGELSAGRWADFVIADIVGEPSRYRLLIKQVYVRGRKVWERCKQA